MIWLVHCCIETNLVIKATAVVRGYTTICSCSGTPPIVQCDSELSGEQGKKVSIPAGSGWVGGQIRIEKGVQKLTKVAELWQLLSSSRLLSPASTVIGSIRKGLQKILTVPYHALMLSHNNCTETHLDGEFGILLSSWPPLLTSTWLLLAACDAQTCALIAANHNLATHKQYGNESAVAVVLAYQECACYWS